MIDDDVPKMIPENSFLRMALDELREFQTEEAVEGDELRRIVTDSKSRTTTIIINGVEIRIRNFIPKKLASLMAKVYKTSEATDSPEEKIELGNYFAYKFLAGICLDRPYTSDKFWYDYDEEVGDAQRIATEVVEMLSNTQQKIVQFRTE